MNGHFDHTSFLRTMCEKWDLEGLTDRDKKANSFKQVFTGTKRTDFPEIPRPQVKEMDQQMAADMPLNDLQTSILNATHVLASETLRLGAEASTEQVSSIQTVGEAMTYLESIRGHLND